MSKVTVVWYDTSNVYYMTNGLSDDWCDPNEYNETKNKLERELLEYESRS